MRVKMETKVLKERVEAALEAELPKSSAWTRGGEIVESENKKFICGTNPGHFYPVIYEKNGIYVGVRKVITHGGIRVRAQATPEAELPVKLSEIRGFTYKKRDREAGRHYSNSEPVSLEEAVKIAKQCIDILDSSTA